MTKEALKLALKALETNNKAWKHLADSGDAGFWEAEEQPFYELSVKAITAIKEALANEALEKKAENARELGLDYEPEHGWTPERIAGMARLKEAQDKKLAQPEQQYHAVNAVHKGQQCYVKTQPKEPEQKPVAWMVWGENNVPSLTFTKPSDKYVFDSLYMTPPQRKPLTDEEIQTIAKEHIAVGTRSFEEFVRRIEAAHGIKGEA